MNSSQPCPVCGTPRAQGKPAGLRPSHGTGTRPSTRPSGTAPLTFLAAYAALARFATKTLDRLPDHVATHFGMSGEANGWMTRQGYVAFLILLPLALAGFLWLIGGLVRRLPARFVSLPRRDYWLAPAHLDRTVALLRQHLWIFALLQTGFLGALHLLTLHANRVHPPHLELGGLLLAVIAYMTLVIVWVTHLLMRFAETDPPN